MGLQKRKNKIDDLTDKSGGLTKKSQKQRAEEALAKAKKLNRPVIFVKQGQSGNRF